jgi:hypothetical protein
MFVTVADWLCTAIHNFSQHLFSKVLVLRFTFVFVVTLSAVYWYSINSLVICKGSTPSSFVLIFIHQCLPTEFHLHYFPIEELFRL